MTTTTTITRDTNYSFVKEIVKENGESFSRKLEEGSTEYANACLDFHMANIAIVKGNKIIKQS